MSYLAEIIDRKRTEVRRDIAGVSLRDLQSQVAPCTTDVLGALNRPGELAFIAEHKRKSPSKGPIRADSDPAEIAQMYEAAGAAAMSVLTDRAGFDGCGEDLQRARAAVSIPILCKDFIVSPMQVFQARLWGADIVLLIVAALTRGELSALFSLVRGLGMTALIEVHDEHELNVAERLGARLIGVNNRDLHSFEVDIAVSERLAKHFGDGVIRISESGISTENHLRRLADAGYHGVLVGERLMRAPHPGEALAALISGQSWRASRCVVWPLRRPVTRSRQREWTLRASTYGRAPSGACRRRGRRR